MANAATPPGWDRPTPSKSIPWRMFFRIVRWTVYACAVYFWARVAHLIVYTMGLPVFRTLAFTVGFLAQAVLALAIFKIL